MKVSCERKEFQPYWTRGVKAWCCRHAFSAFHKPPWERSFTSKFLYSARESE
jgi:hypothetical protein